MKKILLFSFFVVLVLTGCKKYKNKEVYANVPVYMDYETFRNSFRFEKDAAISGTGNIYVYNQYIFLCEEDRGIHIINNSVPASPVIEGFMNIPGNTQLAVNGNYLYANSYIDLLVIDISNISQPQLVNRLTDVFEYTTPAVNDKYPVADVHKDRGVVVKWEIEKTKEVSGFMKKYFVSDCEECEQTEMTAKSMSSMPTSLSGSMSKFTISNNYLYCIDDDNLLSFNLGIATHPLKTNTDDTYHEAETIFSQDGYLYVGSTTGMVIYDANKYPAQPEYEGSIEHADACDPVVVRGDYAFLTLRSGTECDGIEDELQVIDLSNRKNPKLEKTFQMTNPHGLGYDGDLLFVCDGTDGLKVFNSHNPLETGNQLLYHLASVQVNDVILNNGLAILVGDHGIYQYNYSYPVSLQYVSSLDF